MPKEIDLPDGTIGEFPDSMGDDEIKEVLRRKFPPSPYTRETIGGLGRISTESPSPAEESTKSESTYAGAVPRGVGKVLAGLAGMPKQLLTPHATYGATKEEEVKMGPVGRLLYNAPADIAQGMREANVARRKSAESGENWAGQTLSYMENLPIAGGGVQKAEEAGPGYAKFTPETLEAVTEGATMAATPNAAKKVLTSLPKIGGAVARVITRTTPRGIKDLVEQTKTDNAEIVEKNKVAEAKHAEKTSAAKESRSAEAKSYADKKAELAQERQDAQQQYKTNAAKQQKIEPTQTKLKQAVGNAQAGIETARKNALETGNSKYNTFSEELKDVPERSGYLANALADVTGELREPLGEPTLLKKIEDMLKNKANSTSPVTYDDLQGIYTALGKEISKGTLEGSAFHAMDLLHESIGEEMQRMADSKGLGEHLTEARKYWRLMKQTFGQPFNATDAATKTLTTGAPDIAARMTQANRIRLLGAFDPRLPGLFEHIENLKKGAESLPKPTPERVAQEKLRQAQVKTKPPEPPKLTSLPKAPELAQTKTIGPEDIQSRKLKSLTERTERIKSRGTWIATGAAGYGGLSGATRGKLGSIPRALAEGGIASAGVVAIARILESPKVIEWLTKATPADIAQVPPELRGPGLENIVREAQRQGIKISPALRPLIRGGVAAAMTPVGQQEQQ